MGVDVLVGVRLGVGVGLLLGMGVGLLLGVSDALPGRLVIVNEMEVLVGVAVGVLLGPVMGISRTGAAVSDGTGVLPKMNRGCFVGVKKRLANASCVNTRSAGVALAVTLG